MAKHRDLYMWNLYLSGFTLKEIGAKLDMATTTVWERIYRAKHGMSYWQHRRRSGAVS